MGVEWTFQMGTYGCSIFFFVSLKGALGCAQSDSLLPLRAEVLDPCSSHGCHSDGLGLQGLAGLWML